MKTLSVTLLLWVSIIGYSQPPTLRSEIIGSGAPVIVLKVYTAIDSAWVNLAEKLGNRYQFHLISLPGFDGTTAADSGMLPPFKEQLIQYIVTHHLFRPVIIGQDAGAMLALWVAGSHPYLFSSILVADNFPVSSGNNGYTLTREGLQNPSFEIAHTLASNIGSAETQKADAIRRIASAHLASPQQAQAITERLAAGNPENLRQLYLETLKLGVARKFQELDLPVLVLASAPSQDKVYRRQLEIQYQSLPKKSVVIAPAGRFAVNGDPIWFSEQVKNFLTNGIEN